MMERIGDHGRVHVSAGTVFFKEPINGIETDDSSKRNYVDESRYDEHWKIIQSNLITYKNECRIYDVDVISNQKYDR